MFIRLIPCPEIGWMKWIHFYENLFHSKSSTRLMLQELFQFTKSAKKVRSKNKNLSSAMSVPSSVLRNFAKKLKMEYDKINTVLSSKKYLMKSDDGGVLIESNVDIENCIDKTNCKPFLRTIETFGKSPK